MPSAVLVLCHTDGHGKRRVTSLWTGSDLDIGPDRGSSQRPASPFANRMLAGRPGWEALVPLGTAKSALALLPN